MDQGEKREYSPQMNTDKKKVLVASEEVPSSNITIYRFSLFVFICVHLWLISAFFPLIFILAGRSSRFEDELDVEHDGDGTRESRSQSPSCPEERVETILGSRLSRARSLARRGSPGGLVTRHERTSNRRSRGRRTDSADPQPYQSKSTRFPRPDRSAWTRTRRDGVRARGKVATDPGGPRRRSLRSGPSRSSGSESWESPYFSTCVSLPVRPTRHPTQAVRSQQSKSRA